LPSRNLLCIESKLLCWKASTPHQGRDCAFCRRQIEAAGRMIPNIKRHHPRVLEKAHQMLLCGYVHLSRSKTTQWVTAGLRRLARYRCPVIAAVQRSHSHMRLTKIQKRRTSNGLQCWPSRTPSLLQMLSFCSNTTETAPPRRTASQPQSSRRTETFDG